MAHPPRETGDERLRAFFAIELSAPARAAAAAAIQRLRDGPGGGDVRWVREEKLHVTLRFMGDIDATAVPALVRSVARQTARLRPFELHLGALMLFPSARRPHVVALEVSPETPLYELAAVVERGVVASGFPAADRRFRAHLTLGRLRPRARFSGVTASDTPNAEATPVSEAILFRSELQRSGSRYTPLGRAPLGAPAEDITPELSN